MLLTRSPLSPGPKARFSLDLHVLSAPPAFVLSQDQTLREGWFAPRGKLFPYFEPELKGHAPKGMTGFASGPRAGGLDVRTLLSFQRPRRFSRRP